MTLRLRTTDFVKIVAAIAIAVALSTPASAVNDPIAYWNFNTLSISSAGTPAALGITTISPTTGTGNLSLTGFDGNIDDLSGTALNADTLNPPGDGNVSLSLIPGAGSPFPGNGDFLQFEFSMTGRTNFGVSYATQGTSTGFTTNQWSYSTDGTNFTDFGPVITPPVGSYGLVGPLLSTSALDNAAAAYVRYTVNGGTGATGNNRIDNVQLLHNAVAPPPLNPASLPQPGDIVFGVSNVSPTTTLEVVRGSATLSGGVRHASPWQNQAFIQAVEFDNLGGNPHNAKGNLLGVNFSNSGIGEIYSFATQGTIPLPAPQKIGNAGSSVSNPALGHTGLPNSTLAGLSVSPDNTKIAVVGGTVGAVIVYDYMDGNTMGADASLANGRSTPTDAGSRILATTTQGTAWLDNDTILAFSSLGDLYEVNANLGMSETTLASTLVKTVTVPGIGSNGSSIAYNPDVSPYVYALYSGFATAADPDSQTRLYVFDPTDVVEPYKVISAGGVSGVDISLETQTGREIALDEDGNLFISAFDSTITFIPAAVAQNPGTLTSTSPEFWYQSPVNASSFVGFDIGFSAGLTGDYNGDGKVDAADYVMWRDNPAAFGGDQGYTDWKANFGNMAGSGGALGAVAVPEPTGLALLSIGVLGLWHIRRRAY